MPCNLKNKLIPKTATALKNNAELRYLQHQHEIECYGADYQKKYRDFIMVKDSDLVERKRLSDLALAEEILEALSVLNIQSKNITAKNIERAYHNAVVKYRRPDSNPAWFEMMKVIYIAYGTLKAQELSKINKISIMPNCYDHGDIINTAPNKVIGLSGLSIEVWNAWIWVYGNTEAHSKTLEQAGFCRIDKSTCWYFCPC